MKKFTPKAPKICAACPNIDLTVDMPTFTFKEPPAPAKKESVVTVSTKMVSSKKKTLF